MRKYVGSRRASGGGVSRLAIMSIVAFVVVDILLVIWAITSVRTPPHDPPAKASVVSTTPSSETRTSTPKATATPTATALADAVAPTRVLAAVDANTAWRANTGACPATKATLQLTTDGGKTWKTSDAAAATGASSPVRILATSDNEASVVSLSGDGCTPEFIRTYVAGDNWATYNDELAGTWFVDPGAASKVHAPSGNVAPPCKRVVGLAARDTDHAAVLCSDHTVYRTTNAGAGWGKGLTVRGAVAISAGGSGYVAAATGDAKCNGVTTSSFDATTGNAKAGGCFASGAPKSGAVALAAGGDALWLWVGGKLGHSSDGGVTWQ